MDKHKGEEANEEFQSTEGGWLPRVAVMQGGQWAEGGRGEPSAHASLLSLLQIWDDQLYAATLWYRSLCRNIVVASPTPSLHHKHGSLRYQQP